MSEIIQVWEYIAEGRTLLGEYRDPQYAINRANNTQNDANRAHERAWIDAQVYQTFGCFWEMCDWCAGLGVTWRGEPCERCSGNGSVMVRTTPATLDGS